MPYGPRGKIWAPCTILGMTETDQQQSPDPAVEDAVSEPDTEPAGSTDDAPSGDEVTADEAARGRGNPEAARYRRQLREVERERDQLRETLNARLRQEAERVAQTADGPAFRGLVDGADLWNFGTELDQLLADDGLVDPAKVQEAAQRLSVEHGHLMRPIGNPDFGARAMVPAGGRRPGAIFSGH